jgi:hypothetical protein
VNAVPSVPHSRAFELLPWLVNGTLTGPERDAVEAHARACIVCRREIKQQQRLYAAVREPRTGDVSADAAFDRLERELDQTGFTSRRWRHRYAAAAPFAIATAAGLSVLAVLLWLTPLPELGSGNYSTLATPPTGDAVLLDVVFAEGTTAAEIQDLLRDIEGEIVAGPSKLGRYNVRLTADNPSRADSERLAELLTVLAADPRVRFAGPALAEPAP